MAIAATMLRRACRTGVTPFLVLLSALTIAGALPAIASAEVGAPSIASDRPDYAPGDTVTLQGSGWGVGEVVHIRVNDNDGQTWSRDVDVTADFLGNISDQFVLPDWFVAVYTVTATGPVSGTATTTFTDGNVKIAAAPSGTTFTLTWQKYNQLGCSGTVIDSGTEFNVGSSPGAIFSKGAGNTESIRWVAADAATTPAGRVFRRWTSPPPGDPFTANFGGDRHAICTNGFQGNGTRDYVANYNTAPSVAAPASQSANEGTPTSFSLGSFTDPEADSPWTVTVDWGDGSTDSTFSKTTTGSLGTLSHTYDDGPNTHTVTVTVTGNGNGTGGPSGSATFTVTVNNIAPTATFPTARTVNEGSASTFAVTPPSDPSSADTTAGFHYAFSCTGGPLAGATYAGSGTSASVTCSFPDGPSSQTVRARIIDKDGGFSEYTTAVTVANVAPTVAITGPSAADEGQTKTYSFTVSDPGQDTFAVSAGFPDCGSGGSPVAGSLTTSAAGGSFQCSFADGPASPNVRIKVEDSDGAGSDPASTAVTVANVAPTVALTGPTAADEGQTKTYSFTVSDPGQDTFTVSAGFPDCGSGGSLVAGSLTTSAAGGSFQCSFPDGPASTNVRIKVDDSDGAGSNVASVAVTVANVAPTVSLSGTNAADEGQTKAYNFSVTDPGQDTFTVSPGFPDCGTGGSLVSGSPTTNASGGSFECSFPDGPASPSVRIKVDDSDGAPSNVDSIAVSVANVAPTATLAASNDFSVAEGSTHTYSYSISDPGQDTVSAVVTSCSGTGTKTPGSDSFTNTSGTFQCGFADGPDSSTVSAAATDSDGATGPADTQTVTVNNVAPTVTLNGAATVDEGSTHTYSFAVTDPGADAFSVSSSYPTCGTGGSYVSGSLSTTVSGGSFDCSFPDGPAATSVAIKVADSDGASDTDSEAVQIVHVSNLAPVVTAAADQSSDEGDSHSFSLGSFSDDGTGDALWAVSVNWGDGSPASTFSTSSMGSLGTLSHIYADGPATHTVAVTVTDKDGDSGSATFDVTVANVAPTVTLSGPNAADEGQPKSYSFSVTDPGADSFTVAAGFPDCGAGGSLVGSVSTTASGGSFQCSFPDGPASPTVRIQVADSDGTASNVGSIAVTVSNVAPTVSLSGATTADEGQTKTYSFTVTDPGQDTFAVAAGFPDCGSGGNLVTGSLSTNASGGSFQCSFPDGPASPTVGIRVSDSDNADSNIGSIAVTVANVAPTVSLSGVNAVDEGQTKTYNFSVTDPGQDTFTVAAGFPDCGTGGSFVTGSLTTNASGGSFQCSFPDGPASPSVRIKVDDSDGAGSNVDAIAVTVSNVAPTVTIAGDDNVNEGSTHTYSFTVTDPGQDTFSVSSGYPSCGAAGTFVAGSLTTTSVGGSFDCHFADGPATTSVAVRVADSDGASGTDSEAVQVVAIANVAPNVAAAAAQSADEGDSHSFALGSFSDDGVDDSPWLVSVDWGDGSPATAFSTTSMGSLGTKAHTYADGPATYTVTVAVKDNDGDSGSAIFDVTVANVAPTVSLSGANAADEGQTKTYDFSVTDPGEDTSTVAAGFPDCGTGGSFVTGSLTMNASGGSFQCSFPDGPASPSVRIKVADSDGAASNVGSIAVAVHNVAPTITLAAGNDLSVNEGSTHAYAYSISDPGQDTVSAVVTGCSGTGTKTAGSDSFTDTSGSFQCSFADGPNSSTVSAAATDSDGDTGVADTQTVTVQNVAPTVTLSPSNDLSVNEGSTHTYAYSIVDPGLDTVSSVVTSCGANGTESNASNMDTAGSFDCTFPDGPASSTVSARATDSDGDAGNTATQSVAVANVAPNVTIDGPANVDEGSVHTYTFTITDPGQDGFVVSSGYPTCGTGGTYVTGSLSTSAGGGSFDCSFPDGPATTNVAIKVADSDGASDTASEAVRVVAVANVPPSVTAPADQSSDEGESHSFALGSFTDNGENDAPWNVTVGWGDGSPVASFAVTSAGSLGSLSHAYADGPATHMVTVTVTDKDGGIDARTFQVSVRNVAPTVSVSGPAAVDEGQARTYTFSVSDPGQDGFSVKAGYPDCGSGGSLVAGSVSTTAGGGTFDCSFPDGPASPTVSVQVRDADEAAGSPTADSNVATRDVTVANVAPAVSITSGATSADENQSKTYGFSVSDPGVDTYSASTGYPDCGTGGTLVGGSYSVSGNSGSQSGSFDCKFPDGPASPSVRIRFTDSDGDAGNIASRSVTVANLAPTATFNAPSSVTEGQSISLSLTSPSDASSVDAAAGFQYRFSCDNGVTWTGWSTTSTHSCPTSDNGTRTVKGEIRDKDGGSNEYTKQVTVGNAAPEVTVTSPTFGKLYAKPAGVAMTAMFADAGTGDTHSCSFAWDDGGSSAGTVAESSGSGTCSGTHTYTTAGVYTVKVTVTDDDGASTTVEWMIVVYDPNGGFVTGGGWIEVAPGSYPADPTLSGRANFGFNSQYKKGATVPTGETEFQFKVGDLNFHSTRYDFLVVSGYKAQYKGVGDVNGVPGYSFRLTAYDGGLMNPAGFDKFRIKITDASGAIVFDNRIGKSDDIDAADPQAISGGGVVIHKA